LQLNYACVKIKNKITFYEMVVYPMSDEPTILTDASDEVAAASDSSALATQLIPMPATPNQQGTACCEPLDENTWAAQRRGRLATLLYLIFSLIASLLLILYLWMMEQDPSFSHVRSYLYAFLSAVCGGTVYCFQAYNRYFTRHVLDISKNWTWYITHPLLSGTYGAIFFALLNGHLLGIQVASDAASTIIGFSFLVGFGTKQVDAKIKDTLNALFGTSGR
jgi:hypothetical protein